MSKLLVVLPDGKSLTFFKATAALRETYGIDYISKTDSDSLFSMKHYFTFTESELAPAPYNRRMYGGPSWGNFVKSSVYAAGQRTILLHVQRFGPLCE